MTTLAASDPYSNPSLFKRSARIVLGLLHGVLPERWYAALYHPAFGVYQWCLRWQYGRKLQRARRAGDPQARCMERVLAVMPHSLIGSPGLEHTHDLAQGLVHAGVAGAFVECGVAQGGCAALLASVARGDSNRHCWFFDSYEGLPDPTDDDFSAGETGKHIRPLPKGSCLGTIEQVSDLLFNKFGFSRNRISLVKGWFQDTLGPSREQVGTIALLRVDGDWYESTMCCLEQLYDQVAEGGQIIIDDYCSCYGARKATDEFLEQRGLDVTLVPDGRGGCSFRKPAAAESTSRQVA